MQLDVCVIGDEGVGKSGCLSKYNYCVKASNSYAGSIITALIKETFVELPENTVLPRVTSLSLEISQRQLEAAHAL